MQDTNRTEKPKTPSLGRSVSPPRSLGSYKSPTGPRHAKLKKENSHRYSTPDIGYSAEAEFDNRALRDDSFAELSLPQWVL
jgi:hypothetical protein